MKRFEVLRYETTDVEEACLMTEDFSTLKAAMNFYEKNKNDSKKFGWFITKRNSNWEIVETYIY